MSLSLDDVFSLMIFSVLQIPALQIPAPMAESVPLMHMATGSSANVPLDSRATVVDRKVRITNLKQKSVSGHLESRRFLMQSRSYKLSESKPWVCICSKGFLC